MTGNFKEMVHWLFATQLSKRANFAKRPQYNPMMGSNARQCLENSVTRVKPNSEEALRVREGPTGGSISLSKADQVLSEKHIQRLDMICEERMNVSSVSSSPMLENTRFFGTREILFLEQTLPPSTLNSLFSGGV